MWLLHLYLIWVVVELLLIYAYSPHPPIVYILSRLQFQLAGFMLFNQIHIIYTYIYVYNGWPICWFSFKCKENIEISMEYPKLCFHVVCWGFAILAYFCSATDGPPFTYITSNVQSIIGSVWFVFIVSFFTRIHFYRFVAFIDSINNHRTTTNYDNLSNLERC